MSRDLTTSASVSWDSSQAGKAIAHVALTALTIQSAASVSTFSVPTTANSITTAGYALAGDGGGAVYKRVASPPAHAGKIQSLDGAWWEVSFTGPVNVLAFGADKTGALSSTTAFNNALTFANTFASPKPVYAPQGSYLISTSILMSGFNTLEGDGPLETILIPSMVDGTGCIRVTPFNTFWTIRNLSIQTSLSTTAFAGGTAAPNCIGIDASNTASTYDTRYRIDNVMIQGCAIGWKQVGWLGVVTKLHIQYCTLGLSGDLLNASNIGLYLESNRQGMVLTNSFGTFFPNYYEEEDVASAASSTVDGCRGVVFSAPYWEAGTTHPRSTPFITFGATSLNYDIEIQGATVASSSAFTAGIYPIALDKVQNGRITAVIQEGTQLRTVSSTSSTKNVEISVVTGSGGALHDASLSQDQVLNYFANPKFENGFKGWDALVVTRATAAAEATITRRANKAMRLTCSAGAGFNYAQWQINGAIPLALRGKTVRMGAWIWVPNIAAYADAARTLFPSIGIASFNGATLVTGTDTSTTLANNAWNYITASVAVQSDATQIQLNVYANQSSTVPAGTEYVVISDITLVEDACLVTDQKLGRYKNSDLLPLFVNGNMILMATATPTDVNQNFIAGDEVLKSNPSASTSPGWVCVTAGTGGTAVWKAMAALGA